MRSAAAVDEYLVALLDPRADPGRLAVDRDTPRGNQAIGLATGAVAALRDVFVQTHARIVDPSPVHDGIQP